MIRTRDLLVLRLAGQRKDVTERVPLNSANLLGQKANILILLTSFVLQTAVSHSSLSLSRHCHRQVYDVWGLLSTEVAFFLLNKWPRV